MADETLTTSDIARTRDAGPAEMDRPATDDPGVTTGDRLSDSSQQWQEARATPAPPSPIGRGGVGTDGGSSAAWNVPDHGAGPAAVTGVEAAPTPPATPGRVAEDGADALLPATDTDTYRMRWESVQGGFVDEPRAAVEQADGLVAEVMQHLARRFAEERSHLESQWTSGADVGTEQLRVALQRYRLFFQRLLER